MNDNKGVYFQMISKSITIKNFKSGGIDGLIMPASPEHWNYDEDKAV